MTPEQRAEQIVKEWWAAGVINHQHQPEHAAQLAAAIREAEGEAIERAAREVEGHHFCRTADEMQGICECRERADAVRALKSTA